jgi:hypothetical protein
MLPENRGKIGDCRIMVTSGVCNQMLKTHDEGDAEWTSFVKSDRPVNESNVRKMMRGQPTVKSHHQYWLNFTDENALKRRLLGHTDAHFTIEERAFDIFTLGLDWCSMQLLRQQKPLEVAVIVTVGDERMLGCLFHYMPSTLSQ